MNFSVEDHEFMRRALHLAERGLYTATPNPRVGSVLVKNGIIIGEGWHERTGEGHAEVHALRAAGDAAKAATLYVSLEPCSHFGRTPPCVDAIVNAQIARVVVAVQDPNPLVAGRGIAQLRRAGLIVEVGLLEEAARELNIGYFSRMLRDRPWVRSKIAASLDGKTALASGQSQWITGSEARRDGHHWRARACAILTGSGTIAHDDPQLTVREVNTTRQPLKIIVDHHGELSPNARALQDGQVLVIYADKKPRDLAEHVEALAFPNLHGKIDFAKMFNELAKRGINELHCEAGAKLNGALLAEGWIDEILLYLAPCILGDSARGMFALPELTELSRRVPLTINEVKPLAEDYRIRARVTNTTLR